MYVIITPEKTTSKSDHMHRHQGLRLQHIFLQDTVQPTTQISRLSHSHPEDERALKDGEKTGSGANWECALWASTLAGATSQQLQH